MTSLAVSAKSLRTYKDSQMPSSILSFSIVKGSAEVRMTPRTLTRHQRAIKGRILIYYLRSQDGTEDLGVAMNQETKLIICSDWHCAIKDYAELK
jgi:hypothetical protein